MWFACCVKVKSSTGDSRVLLVLTVCSSFESTLPIPNLRDSIAKEDTRGFAKGTERTVAAWSSTFL